MTDIYFLPDMAGRPYVAPYGKDCCLMDTMAVDSAGLVSLVEEMCGLHRDAMPFNRRLCLYYPKVKEWLGAHPGNVLAESFAIAPLKVARRMLIWRDELRLAQWDFRCDDAGSRLGALAGIEDSCDVPGLPDRILDLCAFLREGHIFSENVCRCAEGAFRGVRILLQVDRTLLRPAVGRLLDALEGLGAEISRIPFSSAPVGSNLAMLQTLLSGNDRRAVSLDERDSSFRLMEFDTPLDMSEYLAFHQNDLAPGLWVDADSKQTDNRRAALRLPASGSAMSSRSRILDLLPLALSLYDGTPNIGRLVEWLSAPLHPLPARFRYQLAERIAASGGFLNVECRGIVDRYLDGEFEYPGPAQKSSELLKAERVRNVRLYVPYMDPGADPDVCAEKTLSALSVWARQRVVSLADDDQREALTLQLVALADAIDLLMLLFAASGLPFSLSLSREWIAEIPSEVTVPHCPACVGSVFSVSSPSDIASDAEFVLWSGLSGGGSAEFECGFLLPCERETISGHARFWDREAEALCRQAISILPFRAAAGRLVLAYARRQGGQMLVAHPLLSRLRAQVLNLEAFVSRPSLRDEMKVEVAKVDNAVSRSEYRFSNAANVVVPEMMSASALESLVLNPFDFMFGRILNFAHAGHSNLPDLATAKGKVAHAVIARLFSPPGGEDEALVSDIRARFASGYRSAFKDAVNECGALLMLPEHRLEAGALLRELEKCIGNLLEILDVNGLRVLGCERHLSCRVGLAGDVDAEEADDLHGFLDMHLAGRSGEHVVFDFKWTGSRNYHKGLLEKNRSVQLAVYSQLIRREAESVRSAYFLMPAGRLVSCASFMGKNVEVVEPENSDDVMRQLVNSYRFRREQILSGVLEEGEGHPLADLDYEECRAGRGLFPLAAGWDDPEVKAENAFSEFNVFKGRI